MSAETVEVLRRARALIADPERWCQDAVARDRDGGRVTERDARACRWCAVGAVYSIRDDEVGAAGEGLLERAGREQFPEEAFPILHVNDDLGHAAVLAMYDRAIALAESEPES